jgi:ADP-heptose:LPS heptosyltransferase
VQSILIVHQGAIGDFILSLPAFEAIHHSFPQAEFTFLSHPHIVETILARPYVKRVLDCSASCWALLYSSEGKSAPKNLESLGELDSVFVFARSSSQRLVDNLTNSLAIPVHRVDPFPEQDLDLHLAEYQCLQLDKIGIPAIPAPETIIAPPRQGVVEALTFFRQNFSQKDRLVLLHPGSGGRQKLWTPIGWLNFIQRLSAQKDLQIALLQGPADGEIVRHLHSQLEAIPLTTVENWRLGRLAALISKSSLYLGNDSGITHLAAACGTPTIALFGPTDPRIWAPRGPRVKIVRWQAEGTANSIQTASGAVSEPPPEAETVWNQAVEWLAI